VNIKFFSKKGVEQKMIDDLFPNLPFDCEGASKEFKPYSYRTEKALEFLKQNALPFFGKKCRKKEQKKE